MKTIRYLGRREERGCVVVAQDAGGVETLLPLRLDLDNHSPTGFEWGYAGSGPAQLALAILADALADDVLAVRLHQTFKRDFIQDLPYGQPDGWTVWTIAAEDVRQWASSPATIGDA